MRDVVIVTLGGAIATACGARPPGCEWTASPTPEPTPTSEPTATSTPEPTLTLTPTPEKPTPTTTPTPFFGELTLKDPNEAVNIRTGPGTNYQILETLDPHETFLVRGRAADGKWMFGDLRDENGNLTRTNIWVTGVEKWVNISGDKDVIPVVSPELIPPTPRPTPTRPSWLDKIPTATATPAATATPTATATPEGGVPSLPTPRPGHIIYEVGDGRSIALLGQEWTQEEIALLKQRLEWVRQNDPTLYKYLFKYGVFKKGNEYTSWLDRGGGCTGDACTEMIVDPEMVKMYGKYEMDIPDKEGFLVWGDPFQSNLRFYEGCWHEYARYLEYSKDPAFKQFKGIKGSKDKDKGNQLAVALSWLATDRMERVFGKSLTTIGLKNSQLKYIGLIPQNADYYTDYGIDLSYLYDDPGIRLALGLD